MQLTIDKYSGFCFGVVYAIEMAEAELSKSGKLYCLGDIVHNNMEVDRLNDMGLEIINHQQFLSRLKENIDFHKISTFVNNTINNK